MNGPMSFGPSDRDLGLTDEEAPSSKDVPENGWRCFHCDEVISSRVDAENHFGRHEGAEPACKIKAAGEFALLQALRNAEDELSRYRSEDSDIIRVLWSTRADHATALRREEEKGYARGLRDAQHVETTCSECRGAGVTTLMPDGHEVECGSCNGSCVKTSPEGSL